MDAIPPIGAVEANDEAERAVEIGVHQGLQRMGAERLAERRHAPERPGVRAAGIEEADASLVQERGDVLGRQKSAQQHLGCGGVDNDALPKPMLGQQLLKFRILVEIGARDLAAQGADKRLEIDALHHRFRVAARGGRRKLPGAGQRPAPIGRHKDDERDRATDKGFA